MADIHWIVWAYAHLGYVRNKMKPEDVVTIQDFLEAAQPKTVNEQVSSTPNQDHGNEPESKIS